MTERERLYSLFTKIECPAWFVDEKQKSEVVNYLLENGVIVPTCKVGDTVYQRTNGGDIYEGRIRRIIYDVGTIAFDESAIGNDIFLTKEEA